MINEIENATDKNYEMQKYVQGAATEIELKKLFINEQKLYLLKMSVVLQAQITMSYLQ